MGLEEGVRRRDFIKVIAGSATAWPLVARAQRATIPQIGYVSAGVPEIDVASAGLRQGLSDLGYSIGRNLAFEARYAESRPERIPALIDQLLALNIDVLITVGTPVSRAAQRATKTVPIVCMSGNPVGAGLVASLSHPGGNITGMSILSGDYSAKWLELLIQAAPKLRRVAALWNPDNQATLAEHDHLQNAARILGIELTFLSARPSEIEPSMAALTPATTDGLVVTDDVFLEPLLPRLIALAAERRLPALYAFSTAVKQGGLMSYSANFFEMWRHLARYVDRILRGEHPADLPVEQATEVALDINVKTAKALGLTFPPTLLAVADEVVE
jgi:putative tryptophan/tyrosine transport system substrate-binding protein